MGSFFTIYKNKIIYKMTFRKLKESTCDFEIAGSNGIVDLEHEVLYDVSSHIFKTTIGTKEHEFPYPIEILYLFFWMYQEGLRKKNRIKFWAYNGNRFYET